MIDAAIEVPSRKVERAWLAEQPYRGIAGLSGVLAASLALGFLPGQVEALKVTVAIVTFGLPLLVACVLWWDGWPLRGLPRAARGVVFLLLFAVAAVALAVVGQALTGRVDPPGLLGRAGAFPVFPYGFVPAATIFVTMLQITFVWRGMPFRLLPPLAAGGAALATAWVAGVAAYFLLLGWDAPHAVPSLRPTLGAIPALAWPERLLCVVVVQMVCFMLLDGWPLNRIRGPVAYWLAANLASLGGGLAVHAGAAALGVPGPALSAACGCITAACLIQGMLFEGWPFRRCGSGARRLGSVLGVALVAAALYALLLGLGRIGYPAGAAVPPLELWVAGVALNLVAALVIVHCAVFARWPLPAVAAG